MVVLLVGLIVSCHKDPKPNESPNEQTNEIRFGDTAGMTIIHFDTIVRLGETIELDIDADGSDDFELESYYDGPMMMDIQSLYLACLRDNVELLGEVVEKESYTHYDTTISTSWDGTITIVEYLTTYNTCEMLSEYDEVHPLSRFMVYANEANDLFRIDDCFQSTKVNLFLENTQATVNWDGSNDTINYYWTQKYIYDCNNFPTNTEKYIGFKITKDGKPRLGWLKLNLIGVNTVEVHLLETAIQEKSINPK